MENHSLQNERLQSKIQEFKTMEARIPRGSSSPPSSPGRIKPSVSIESQGDNRYDSLQLLIREKGKENKALQEIVAQLKSENHKLKTRIGSKGASTGIATLDNMTTKLNESYRQNDELKSEILGLKRIQNEQGRALTKMVHENNYPLKIKGLIDELKYSKDKISEQKEQLDRE